MIRDKYRDKEHFLLYIKTKTESHENRVRKIVEGQITPERIISVKRSMVTNLVQKAVTKYSMGLSIDHLTDDFNEIVDLIEESWVRGSRKLVGLKNTVLDQYNIDFHIELLNLLSMGFLCSMPDEFFERLGKIIKDDNVIDSLFEYILAAKLDSWEMRRESESYAFKLYLNLKKAIVQSDKEEAEKLLKVFLEKDWVKEQKKAQMFTEPNKSWYHGMWSF
jgi:hypothetical protein